MPTIQAINANMDLLFELLIDITLSSIGYFVLLQALFAAAGTVTSITSPVGWTLHPISALLDQREEVISGVVLSLSVARVVLRWRGHLVCIWRYISRILRWLSPLSPKPFGICVCCLTVTDGEQTSSEGHQHVHQYQHLCSQMALSSSSPTRSAAMEYDERSAYNAENLITTDDHRQGQRGCGIFL